MYDKVQIEIDKLLTVSTKDQSIKILPVTNNSKEILVTENKIEQYENEIAKQTVRKNRLFQKAQNNAAIMKKTKIAMGLILGSIFIGATAGLTYYGSISPLVTNIGMITFITTATVGCLILNKADKNEEQLYQQMNTIDKIIDQLDTELDETKKRKMILELEKNKMEKQNQVVDPVTLEKNYNKELKAHYIDCYNQILEYKKMAQNPNSKDKKKVKTII